MLPKLAMRAGLIHTALRNRLKSNKVCDLHIIAKTCSSEGLVNSNQNPKNTLLISPVEREILRDSRSTECTPSPIVPHSPLNAAEESDGEDRGAGVSDASTLSLWVKYLAEVFRDEEIDTGYVSSNAHLSRTYCAHEREEDNEFEDVPTAVIREFLSENGPGFPQEE
ncbi:hypothetical protein GN958_ATG08577 [Phytophthora infestans]|uniref:Uncharacterized protein n=1 Tax=Phytophthora infestans TaxID=4787 RepID=A0A8S9UNK9_PHYIN|nr:hypothetical protein GN958_ATG08577 [Phytophthora infestans]